MAVFSRDTPPVQLNVSARLSPSASPEVPEQVRVEDVLTPEAGEYCYTRQAWRPVPYQHGCRGAGGITCWSVAMMVH